MGRLLKYFSIVYSILIILAILGYSFDALFGIFHLLSKGINALAIYGIPLLIVFISALYIIQEKQNYFKSLLISFSYIFGSFIIWFRIISHPYGYFALPHMFCHIGFILGSTLIINGIILFIIKRRQ